jgi:hypothetical protein
MRLLPCLLLVLVLFLPSVTQLRQARLLAVLLLLLLLLVLSTQLLQMRRLG